MKDMGNVLATIPEKSVKQSAVSDDVVSRPGVAGQSLANDEKTIRLALPDGHQQLPTLELAITGRDWLAEHLCRFPSSPVKELLNLKYGKVKIVAVVSNDLSVSDARSLRQFNTEREVPLRVASEYVNIADKYARENKIGFYRVIPTWGATEAFLPEDADLLIENTQTGGTIARHNLRIIDNLFESTACLIGSRQVYGKSKGERMGSIIESFHQAVG